MNSQSEVLLLLGFMIAVLSPIVLNAAVILYYRLKIEYRHMKNPALTAYTESKTCDDPHKWTTVTLALRELPPGNYQVCIACGVLTGNTDVMLTEYIMKQVREKLELAAQREELENDITDRIEDITRVSVDRRIAAEFPDEFQSMVYLNKLRALVQFGFKAREEATDKVAAELKAQTELDARYKDWPSARKGNA